MVRAVRYLMSGAAIALMGTMMLAQTAPSNGSGIEGTIVFSPARPGPITRDDPAVAAVANTSFLVKAGEKKVATFTTDAEGRFHVALPAGHYVVVPEGATPPIGNWRFEAVVIAGRITKVNWTADSGMR